jgi:hypothetical protein
MRYVLASLLFVGLAFSSRPVAADDAKKKDEPAKTEEKKDEKEVAKCLIVKAGDKDVTPPVEVDFLAMFKGKKAQPTPAIAKTMCKSQSNKPASEWIRDNGVCTDGGKKTFKYTVAFGVPGKEEKIEQNVICAKKK